MHAKEQPCASGPRSSFGCGQVKYVFKNLVRDWSEEGAAERAQSYGRMLTELRARLPLPPPPLPVTAIASLHQQQQQPPPPPRVLVPGAGQGRLCLEAAIQVAWFAIGAMGTAAAACVQQVLCLMPRAGQTTFRTLCACLRSRDRVLAAGL